MKKPPRELDELFDAPEAPFELWVTLDYPDGSIELEWIRAETGIPEAEMRVWLTNSDELSWEWTAGHRLAWRCRVHAQAVRSRVDLLRSTFPCGDAVFAGVIPLPEPGGKSSPEDYRAIDLPPGCSPWRWLEQEIMHMARQLRGQFSPLAKALKDHEDSDYARYLERLARREQQTRREAAEREARIQAASRRIEAERRRKLAERRERAKHAAKTPAATPPAPQRPPLLPVPVRVEFPALQFQDSLLSLPDLRSFLLRERAAQWWVSNQSDDLLALPYCHIERFDYQLRTALRVIGPLRGRALLSDEVGLGKTIEAGLVLKEYLTRGMIKRFLVLTVPSLVDQWEEELEDKFGVACVTTNQPAFRSAPAAFWREKPFIIASLHTLKQPAHLAVAQSLHWDLLVVDEAHYLRNRTSQA
jgi:hypothetical protein